MDMDETIAQFMDNVRTFKVAASVEPQKLQRTIDSGMRLLMHLKGDLEDASAAGLKGMRAAAVDVRRDADLVRGGLLTLLLKYREVSQASIEDLHAQHAELVAATNATSQQHQEWNDHIAAMIHDLADVLETVNNAIGKVVENERDLDEYANLAAKLNEMNVLLEKHEQRISVLEGRLSSYQERNAQRNAAAARQRNANAATARQRNDTAAAARQLNANSARRDALSLRYGDLALAVDAAKAAGAPASYDWEPIQAVMDGRIEDAAQTAGVLRTEARQLRAANAPATRASYDKVAAEIDKLLLAKGSRPVQALLGALQPADPKYQGLALALTAAKAADALYDWEPIDAAIQKDDASTAAVFRGQVAKLRAAIDSAPEAGDTYTAVIAELDKLLPNGAKQAAKQALQFDLRSMAMPTRRVIASDDPHRSGQLKTAIDNLNNSLSARRATTGGGREGPDEPDTAVTKGELKSRLRILNETYRVMMSMPAILKLRALSPKQIGNTNFTEGFENIQGVEDFQELIRQIVQILYCPIDEDLQNAAKISPEALARDQATVGALRALKPGNAVSANASGKAWVRRSAIHDGLLSILDGTRPLTPEATKIIANYIVVYTADCDGLLDIVSKLDNLSSVLAPPPPRVLTYVRLRSNNPYEFNKRFSVSISSDRKMLEIAHYPTRFAMYSPTGKELLPSSDPATKASIASHNEHWQKKNQGMVIDPNDPKNVLPRAPYEYRYGPLTRVFAPIEDNEHIAANCTAVTELLRAGKSVFMIGYGASGAGKTSALVHLKTGTHSEDHSEDGVLVKLFDTMKGTYDQLSVMVYEYKPYLGKAGDSEQISVQDKPEVFEVRDGKYVQAPDPDNPGKWREELGSYMSHMINGDARLVRPTPNNPKSSRSHVLAVVQLFKKGGVAGPSLYLADLAGIESRFLCKDMDELHRFARILSSKDIQSNAKPELDYADANIDGVYATIARGFGGGGGNSAPKRTPPQRAAPPSEPVEAADTTHRLVPLQAMGDKPSPSDLEWMSATLCNKVNARVKAFGRPTTGAFKFVTKETARNFLEIYFGNVLFSKTNQQARYKSDSIAFAKFFGVVAEPEAETAAGYQTRSTYLDTDDPDLVNLLSQVGQSVCTNAFPNQAFQLPGKRPGEHQPQWDKRLGVQLAYLEQLKSFPLMFLNYDPVDKAGIFVRKIPQAYNQVVNKLKAPVSWHDEMFGCYYEMRREQFKMRRTMLQIIAKSCRLRAFEGAFINRSLQALTQRLLIGELVKAVQGKPGDDAIDMIPTFSEGCLAQQCNPWLDNCFGSKATKASKPKSDVNLRFLTDIRKLILKEGQPSPTVAVFCVANLDQAANNPPSAPYIDTTDLKLEHDRIKNLDEITDIVNIYGKLPTSDAFKVSTAPTVNLDVIDALLTWSEYYADLLGTTVLNDVKAHCAAIRGMVPNIRVGDADKTHGKSPQEQIAPLRKLIDLLETMNATHMLGTLAFTDDMAKFGSGTNACSWSENNTLTLTQGLAQADAGYTMKDLIDITVR